MSNERLDKLEENCDRLNTQVQGISRKLATVEANQNGIERNVCSVHRKDIDEMKEEIGGLRKDVAVIDKNQSNKWPSLIASMIGGGITIVTFLTLFFTLILPAIKGVTNG